MRYGVGLVGIMKSKIDHNSLSEFSIGVPVNAYFACDKNLQLAANFLMENGGFGF